jgi:DNA-binding response OmpR family regulator
MKILLLEDDYELAETIKELLKEENYEVIQTENGYDAEELMIEEEFDLYILDINVKGWNGLKLAKYIREEDDDTPIIFITAIKDINTIKEAYKLGICDYIKKPFDPEELLIRIEQKKNVKSTKSINTLIFNEYEYQLNNQILLKKGEIIPLGKLETHIIEKFLKNKNEIISTEDLIYISGNDNPNALRVLIKKLREKTGIDIENIRGKGYIINEH